MTNKETNKDFENSTKFQALNNQDSHLNIQDLSKINFEINAILNGLEQYMSFNIYSKLMFINVSNF